MEQYCKKGSKVYLEGQLQTREFTDRDGNQRKATEVVLQRFSGELTLLDGRKEQPSDSGRDADEGGFGARNSYAETKGRAPRPAPAGRMADIIDDSIPF